MYKRWMQGAVICLMAVVMLGASPGARFDKLGHDLICACGCDQILLECNHVSCPDSPQMISELHQQINSGGSDISILRWFATKYGSTVTASPIWGGFNDMAWIAPIVMFLLATIGTAILILVWKRNSNIQPSAVKRYPGDDAMRERIRRETEY